MTTRKLTGLGLGTLLGTLVHSSATTVMVVGFIHAGLMNLVQAVPVILGANIGTTLSMQAISFKLSDYALFAVAIGFIISMVSKTTKRKKLGLSLMGFGLLFLGMTLMSDAIKPYRDSSSPSWPASAATPPGACCWASCWPRPHLHHPEQRRHRRHVLRPRPRPASSPASNRPCPSSSAPTSAPAPPRCSPASAPASPPSAPPTPTSSSTSSTSPRRRAQGTARPHPAVDHHHGQRRGRRRGRPAPVRQPAHPGHGRRRRPSCCPPPPPTPSSSSASSAAASPSPNPAISTTSSSNTPNRPSAPASANSSASPRSAPRACA
jgi:hypothetical protein